MTEIEEKLYAQIGLISTRFATIEHQVQEILARYITSGDNHNMLVSLVLDQENLEKKLQHLEKAVLFELHNKNQIRDFIKKIRTQKELRNSFIHGSWHVVSSLDDYVICVYHNRVKKFYGKSSEKDPDNPGWQMGDETIYSLVQLEAINNEIEEIKVVGEKIIEKIDNGGFEFF